MAGDHNGLSIVPSVANERRGNPARVEAFSDGVLAIIITILVFDISIPEDLPGLSLEQALEDVGPTLTAWGISFLVVGTFWIWHREVFNEIRFVNRDLVGLNLLFLLPVSLIPFAASVLGRHEGTAIALQLYGSVLIISTLLRTAMYRYLMSHPELLWEPRTKDQRRHEIFLAASPLILYVPAMLLAVPAPTASLWLYIASPLVYFFLLRRKALLTVLFGGGRKRAEEGDE